MKDKIQFFLGTNDNSIKERTYFIMLSYEVVAAFISGLVFAVRNVSITLAISLFGVFLSTALIMLLHAKFGRIDLFSNIAVYLSNIIFLPLLFYYGGGLKSGMPLIFTGGYIFAFILLDGIQLIFAVVLISTWYGLIMTYAFYRPSMVQVYFSGVDILIDLIICLVVAVLISSMVWLIYQGVYKRIRTNMAEAAKKIDQTGVVKSRFLANMSHELRTPMNAILGMSELLERNDTEGNLAYEAGMIKESAYSLLTTINNVLTFSKLDSGKESLTMNQFRFSQMITDIIYTVSLEVDSERVSFFTSIDPSIPDLVYGDDTKIRNVFTYILFSAVRNTNEGRISLNIEKKSDEKNSSFILSARITDTGYGLTTDEKDSVFSSYEIYDTRRDSQLRRIGIELTICRYLVEMMGGKISVNSIEGVGNDVTFEIRLYAVERAPLIDTRNVNNSKILIYIAHKSRQYIWSQLAEQYSIVADFASSFVAFEAALKDKVYDEIFVSDYNYDSVKSLISTYNLEEKTYILSDYDHAYGDFDKCRIVRRPINCLSIKDAIMGTWSEKDYRKLESRESFTAAAAKILVVDDNIVNVRVASSILEQYGINAFTSTSGMDAIEKIKSERFDLILLDQQMPEMDGIETLKQIRSMSDLQARRVPVICLTANIGGSVRDELLKAGFQDYLAKPIKIRYLEEILKTFLPADMIVSKKENSSGSSVATPEKQNVTVDVNAKTDVQAGLNVDKGLLQMGGDTSTYNLILNTYYKDCTDKLTSIPRMFEEGDIALYNITVHAVKGSSATIGAEEVSELFRQLEMAGKGGDLEFCKENMPNALGKLQEMLGIIKEYLENQGEFKDPNSDFIFNSEDVEESDTKADTNDSANKQVADGDSKIVISTLKQLVVEIDRINFDESDRILEELVNSDYGESLNEKISLIKAAYDDFDYTKVKEIVGDIN